MTARIVTTRYRYKRPPKKRKAVALEVPAIVTRAKKRGKAKAEPVVSSDRFTQTEREAAPANDDRKSAIVIARRRKHALHAHLVQDMSPEEHKRRGDAADALFREIVRRAQEKQR